MGEIMGNCHYTVFTIQTYKYSFTQELKPTLTSFDDWALEMHGNASPDFCAVQQNVSIMAFPY